MNFNNTNWNLYKSFAAAFETGNLYRAADIMMVSRASIGQSIRELERQLGVTLFTPNHRGVTPTAEAVNLYEVIKNASSMIVGAENDLQAFTSESAGVIRIATTDPIIDIFVTDYMKEFCAKYPRVRFDFFKRENMDPATAQSMDFLFDMDYKLLNCGLTTIKLFTMTDIFIASKEFLKKHKLTQTITKDEFLKCPIITYSTEPWADFHKVINPDANPLVIRSYSSNIVYLLVKNSIGIGWLSREQLDPMNDPNIVEVTVDGFSFKPFPSCSVSCAYKTLSRPAKAFLDGMVEFCKRWD